MTTLLLGENAGPNGEFRPLLTEEGVRVGAVYQRCRCGGSRHARHRFTVYLEDRGSFGPYTSERVALAIATARYNS